MRYEMGICESREDAEDLRKKMLKRWSTVNMRKTEHGWIVEAFGPPKTETPTETPTEIPLRKVYRSIGEFERHAVNDFNRGTRSFTIIEYVMIDVKIHEKAIVFDMTYIPEPMSSLKNEFDFKIIVTANGKTVFVDPQMKISVSTELRPPDVWRTKHALYPIIYKLLRHRWQRTLALVLSQIPTAVLEFIDDIVTRTFPRLGNRSPYDDSSSTDTYTNRFGRTTIVSKPKGVL